MDSTVDFALRNQVTVILWWGVGLVVFYWWRYRFLAAAINPVYLFILITLFIFALTRDWLTLTALPVAVFPVLFRVFEDRLPLLRPLKKRYPAAPGIAFGIRVRPGIGLAGVAMAFIALWLVMFRQDIVSRTLLLEPPVPFCGRTNATKLILFLHGWNGDPSSTWRLWPRIVCDDKRFEDAEVIVAHYPTFMVRRNLRLVEVARWLSEQPDVIGGPRYQRVALIAHSLGGLIARELAILARLRGDANPADLLVEVATPHLGANYAALAGAIGVSQTLTEDASKGSSFLAGLTAHWDQLSNRPKTRCYSSRQDWIVPTESAVFQCDEHTLQPAWGHMELVKPEGADDPRYALAMALVDKHFGERDLRK